VCAKVGHVFRAIEGIALKKILIQNSRNTRLKTGRELPDTRLTIKASSYNDLKMIIVPSPPTRHTGACDKTAKLLYSPRPAQDIRTLPRPEKFRPSGRHFLAKRSKPR
jgi:hypothetical protein